MVDGRVVDAGICGCRASHDGARYLLPSSHIKEDGDDLGMNGRLDG